MRKICKNLANGIDLVISLFKREACSKLLIGMFERAFQQIGVAPASGSHRIDINQFMCHGHQIAFYPLPGAFPLLRTELVQCRCFSAGITV